MGIRFPKTGNIASLHLNFVRNDGRHSTALIQPLLRIVKLLLDNGVTPVPVFDGGKLPAKADVEASRQQAREEARAQAIMILRRGGLLALRQASC